MRTPEAIKAFDFRVQDASAIIPPPEESTKNLHWRCLAMKLALGAALCLLAVGCSTAQAPRSPAASSPKVRSFHFEYSSKVTGLPAGSKDVRVWIPLPQSDTAQTISNLKVESSVPHRETRDALYGNRIAYFEVSGAAPAEIPIKVSFDACRAETTALENRVPGPLHDRLLAGDKLAPIGGEASARARQAAGDKVAVDDKAHGIYERVIADVAYDKTVPGWGRGDLGHVCEVGKGNCSDFHALFIAMSRAEKIPAFFEIGFPLPRDKTEGEISGYHCWAWYEARDGVWHPVDASEADKDPSRKDYFFGTICCNRVALSRGRDLVLDPPQAGAPLNFFIYPYVEVDGKPLDGGVEKKFAFKDLSSTS